MAPRFYTKGGQLALKCRFVDSDGEKQYYNAKGPSNSVGGARRQFVCTSIQGTQVNAENTKKTRGTGALLFRLSLHRYCS